MSKQKTPKPTKKSKVADSTIPVETTLAVQFYFKPGTRVRMTDTGVSGVVDSVLVTRSGDKTAWVQYVDANGVVQQSYVREAELEVDLTPFDPAI